VAYTLIDAWVKDERISDIAPPPAG